MSTSRLLQTLIRMTAALGTLTCVLWCVRRRSLPTNVVMLYTLTAAYIMLMSPRTENNTYAMLAPAIGILLTIEADLLRRRRLAWLLLGIALGTVGSFEIGRLFVAREKAIWLAPFMAVLLLAYAIDFLAQERFEGTTTLAENQANPESRLPNVSERSAA